ncbi:zinc-dependent metalloprotease family protein [Kordia algicida OT-1]|uniref:Peptidase M12B domain-containing protein n=1 Tax=Kordia algicida OT-1 TaxID=391587 RepID=A9DN05_9FLAO|nr:zinc-dependent metalloprotease family protein [Kordia algicida]EDP97086.1 hypothetical protein KAOT1_18027 [Kordia algicida OT-1]
MKKNFYFILFVLFSFSGFSQGSFDNYWQDVRKPTTIKQQNSAPTNARVLQLNQPALKNDLRSLREAPRGQKIMLSIPLPNSGMETFEVQYFPIMEEKLAAKFPEIHSYKGVSMDDPNKTIAFGFTQKGFHAQILGGKTILIDPISKIEISDYYQVYFKEDTPIQKNFTCDFENIPSFKDKPTNGAPEIDLGDCQIRTFRLALACTGEYATFHGGTVADAMAAINVTMTRVNGIYNREMAIHMILIGDNEDIIYLDGSSDPYTNNNGGTMLGENQSNINSVIGSNNYDIGHVFSTGGGGIATLNSPCNNSTKARGVTGLPSPIGDVFDVDFVSHEMGHQFGANHTQNNNCQRNGATAVEPGSASTIMGYAGICPANVQANSDDYFHTVSIEEMYDNIINGNSTCGNIINSNNSNPTANAGINRTIPRSTPFFLTGEASEASTYAWEQIDNEVGATMPPATTNAQGPMFRSIQPLATETRFFPNLPAVLNGTTPTWEVLPSVGRVMDFAFTVRDNRFGWGCQAVDEMRVTTDGGSGPFLVTSQSGNQTWAQGTTQTVTWDVANTDSAPVSCEKVDILLSTDGGFTWDVVLSEATENDGSEDIIVPGNITSNGRIIVRCSDNIFYNVSEGVVTVTPPPCDVTDSPDFEINVICDDGTWKVSVQALDLDPQNHWWGLYQTDTQGEVSDANTVDGPIGSIQNGETANFNWLDMSKRYYIKHGIWTEGCYGWREKRIAIEPFYVEPADFHLEDENNEQKDTFCIGEDIWADGNATVGEGRYNIHAWRVVNGQKQWFGSIGWYFGEMDEVNITEEFAALDNPKYFTEGEYILTIAFMNLSECEVWTPVEKSFKVTCCDDFIEANFFLDPEHVNNETFNLSAVSYETYNSSFQHEWYILSSPNLTGGPYTPESFQIGENFSYNAAYGKCYFVIHKVISDCGEVCYGRSVCQSERSGEKGSCELCDEISCDILDQWWPPCSETVAPTNVQVSGSTISWDPVPGATGYIVEPARVWPSDCRCDYPVSITTRETTETSINISLGKLRCSAVVVRAICGEGVTSQPSEIVCIGGERLASEPHEPVKPIDDAQVAPNPNNGEMTFKVTTSETLPVNIEVRSFNGILIYNTTIEARANTTQSVHWNGTAKLSDGIYFVSFKTDKDIITKKVIVQ